jgi:hypothetical protein
MSEMDPIEPDQLLSEMSKYEDSEGSHIPSKMPVLSHEIAAAKSPDTEPTTQPTKPLSEEDKKALKIYYDSLNYDNYLVEVETDVTWEPIRVARGDQHLICNKLAAWVYDPTDDQAMPAEEALVVNRAIKEAAYARYGVVQANHL